MTQFTYLWFWSDISMTKSRISGNRNMAERGTHHFISQWYCTKDRQWRADRHQRLWEWLSWRLTDRCGGGRGWLSWRPTDRRGGGRGWLSWRLTDRSGGGRGRCHGDWLTGGVGVADGSCHGGWLTGGVGVAEGGCHGDRLTGGRVAEGSDHLRSPLRVHVHV